MGPEATADLYLRLIRIFQRKYQAKYDDDFPEIVICNLPIPDVVNGSKNDTTVKEMLVAGAQKMAAWNVDFIAIPCNTVMYYISDLRNAVSIPILSIVEETKKAIPNSTTLGIIGTAKTINAALYKQNGLSVMYPTPRQQKKVTTIIMNILSGRKLRKDKVILQGIIESLLDRGAERVVLGCTELLLLIPKMKSVIDPNQILAEAIVEKAMWALNAEI